MANWKTYVGFFQQGQFETTTYYNFYPVMKKVGSSFDYSFPDPEFAYGRLQLKQHRKEFGTDANIGVKDIDKDIKENILTVVSFDADKFFQDPKDDRYTMGILLESDDDIGAGIKVETLSFRDVFGSSCHVLLPVDTLELASKINTKVKVKTHCAVSKNHLMMSDISCVLKHEQMISQPVTARFSSGFHPTIPWFDTKSIRHLFEDQAVISDGRTIPYHVNPDTWDFAGYTDVSEIELVELRPGAAGVEGALEYNSKSKQYTFKVKKGGRTVLSPENSGGISSQPEIDFLEQTTRFLRESGRDVTKADVINYCICITQGFITTFAGAPGTGKTTLCRLLAQAMGLKEEDGRYDTDARYAEISVERGWTSLRDFIGYPNPFPTGTSETEGNDNIIASNVDACNAFRRMNKNWTSETSEKAPYLMLLDEANLSPIEYYWSQFLRNCQLDDPDELPKRKINLSQQESWRLSPNLRFLATVNFDHTTEELSPRFLDRSWVITLKAPDRILTKNKPIPPQTVPMSELNRLFGHPMTNETFPEQVSSIWLEIQQAFKEPSINMPISPRNILAVEHYCIAASRFAKDQITPEQALDFAVLQKVLPTINGYGGRCETLVNKLMEIAAENNLLLTGEKLTEMSSAADANSQFYQFFIR